MSNSSGRASSTEELCRIIIDRSGLCGQDNCSLCFAPKRWPNGKYLANKHVYYMPSTICTDHEILIAEAKQYLKLVEMEKLLNGEE